MNRWDERNYLGDVIEYFMAKGKVDSAEAAEDVRRMGELLVEDGLDNGSIVLQEHWSLLHEALGDVPRATWHRERQIALVEQLFAITTPEERARHQTFVKYGRIDDGYLAAAMRVLHGHYVAQGEAEKAAALWGRIAEVEGRCR